MFLKEKGITLIALVITIIVMMILAGVTVAIVINDGLIRKAKSSTDSYNEAQKDEIDKINESYSKIQIATGGTVTLKTEELDEYIDKRLEEKLGKGINGINENSKLLNCSDASLSVSTRSLKEFNKTFGDNFDEYFTYDENSGSLVCKSEGWFAIHLMLDMLSNVQYTNTRVRAIVNDVIIEEIMGYTSSSTAEACDSNSMSIYLKENDVVELTKITAGKAMSGRNTASIWIAKL